MPEPNVYLSDEELQIVLECLETERGRLLKEMGESGDKEAHTVYKGDPYPPADTLVGRIFRIGAMIPRLDIEAFQRHAAKREQG